ncbi:MAG: GNAT family N-acetyltransferase [Cyclobacteriaceae bacterium]
MPQASFQFIDQHSAKAVADLRQQYYASLSAPMDGMWDDIIHRSDLFCIMQAGENIGYGATDTNATLVHFFILDPYLNQAAAVLAELSKTKKIRQAYVPTCSPSFLNAALQLAQDTSVFYYFFDDEAQRKTHCKPATPFDTLALELARQEEISALVRFCHRLSGADSNWLGKYLGYWIDREGIYFMQKQGRIIATCELRPSESQAGYADIGAIVDEDCRNKGLGAYLMQEGKKMSYQRNLKPICSCRFDNPASRRMIEKAGYINRHLMIKVRFRKSLFW